jgi:hypothetical protein
MLLYDIFYADGTMDSATTLPRKAHRGAKAVCVNGEARVYWARRGKWVTLAKLVKEVL